MNLVRLLNLWPPFDYAASTVPEPEPDFDAVYLRSSVQRTKRITQPPTPGTRQSDTSYVRQLV